MKLTKTVTPEPYEAPAILDIMPVTIEHVVGGGTDEITEDEEM